jgi:hypothetical protein
LSCHEFGPIRFVDFSLSLHDAQQSYKRAFCGILKFVLELYGFQFGANFEYNIVLQHPVALLIPSDSAKIEIFDLIIYIGLRIHLFFEAVNFESYKMYSLH